MPRRDLGCPADFMDVWLCEGCSNVYYGANPPDVCERCDHRYFENVCDLFTQTDALDS